MSFFSFQDIIACTTGIMVLVTLVLMLELLTRVLGAAEPPPPPDPDLPRKVADAGRRRDALKAELAENQRLLEALTAGKIITRAQAAAKADSVRKRQQLRQQLADEIARAEADRAAALAEIVRAQRASDELARKIKDWHAEIELSRKRTRLRVIRGQEGGKKALIVECSAGGGVVAELPRTGPMRDIPKEVQRFAGDDWVDRFLAWVYRRRDKNAEYFVVLVRPDAVGHWQKILRHLKGWGFDRGVDVWPPEKKLVAGP